MKLPHVHEAVYDLGLFGAMVAAAALQEWSATDLVWSLWISSLVVGWVFLVITALVGNGLLRDEAGGAGARALALAGALFTIGFFTFHFGFFHFVHSVFLNEFFPLVGSFDGFFGADGSSWWGGLVSTAVERYWPFLLATALSRRHAFARSVEADPDREETLFQPYRNVVRMHLLIFVYAGLDAAGMSGWFLYAVLVFYFFPLASLRKLVTGEGRPAAS